MTLPIDYLRKAAKALHRKFPGLTEDDAFQAGVECWLTQPDSTPAKLRGSRAYWAMFHEGLLTIYSSMSEARVVYNREYRKTAKGKAAHSRQEAARQRRRRAERKALAAEQK